MAAAHSATDDVSEYAPTHQFSEHIYNRRQRLRKRLFCMASTHRDAKEISLKTQNL